MVQLSHSCMTTGKTIALTRWTFVDKVMSLVFNMLSAVLLDGSYSKAFARRGTARTFLGKLSAEEFILLSYGVGDNS